MCRHAVSRRDFFRDMVMGLSGMSILDLAARRAVWAQTTAPGAATDVFEIQNVADGVNFAFARPQAVGNCNAAIFANAADVLVVDSHSKPSAAAGLIAQIQKQVTTKQSDIWWTHTSIGTMCKATGAIVTPSAKTSRSFPAPRPSNWRQSSCRLAYGKRLIRTGIPSLPNPTSRSCWTPHASS